MQFPHVTMKLLFHLRCQLRIDAVDLMLHRGQQFAAPDVRRGMRRLQRREGLLQRDRQPVFTQERAGTLAGAVVGCFPVAGNLARDFWQRLVDLPG